MSNLPLESAKGFDAAPEWTFPDWGVFTRSYSVHRQVVRQAAFVRNLKVDLVSAAFSVISDEVRAIGFWEHTPETTTLVARRVSNSKPLTKAVLSRTGLQVPGGRDFGRDLRPQGWKFAERIGFPVVVKPSVGSGGVGVTSNIGSEEHFRLAWRSALKANAAARIVVEKHVHGKDFRLFVVGDRFVAAALRVPAYLDGDGENSITELVDRKSRSRRSNPYVGGKAMKLTPVMIRNLRQLGLSPNSVLEAGRRITLHPVANIGAGGESVDVTDEVHPGFRDIAVRARRALPGAAHAGIDLLARDVSAAPADQEWAICEINTCPDIAMHHFPVSGMPRDVGGALIEHLFPNSRVLRPAEFRRVRAVVSGKATGIDLRKWIWQGANLRGITGWVRAEGEAEALLCGAPNAVEDMLQACRTGLLNGAVRELGAEPTAAVAAATFQVR